ncbi:MAG: hypothetical protein KAJ19_14045 [Gammaproteobacteria bacterium]|nr:hypothetical protein [Gammaproteobacteria bacterium]
MWPLRPDPRLEHDGADGGLRSTRRNVDDEVLDLVESYRFECVTDSLDVPVGNERTLGLDDVPRFLNEVVKVAMGFLCTNGLEIKNVIELPRLALGDGSVSLPSLLDREFLHLLDTRKRKTIYFQWVIQ